MKKAFRTYGLMILPLFLSVMIVSVASAQFAFELPSRAAERVTSYDDIQVTVTGKLALCSHTEKGHIFLDVKGGLPPYTFKWNNHQTIQNRMNLLSGTYTVEITDAVGTKHVEHIIIQPPFGLLLNPLQKTDASCGSGADGSAKISVKFGRGEPYKVTWSHGLEDSWEAKNLKPGTYTVTVADKFNCDVSVSFEIKSAAEGMTVAESIQDLSCSGQKDGKISLNVSGGVAPYTYSWSNGATSKDLTGIASGTYEVLVKDQKGCSFQASYKVGEAVALTLESKITEASCVGNSNGQIELSVKGGKAPYTYIWSDGQTGSVAKNLISGSYDVKVTDASGCFVQEQFTLGTHSSLEVELLESKGVSCSGATDGFINLGVNGAKGQVTVKWSDGILSSLSRKDLKAGTYTIQIKDESGCEVNKSISISEPSPLSARIESTLDVDCAEGSVTGVAWVSIHGGKEPYKITWSNGDKDAREINFFHSGTFKVTVTDASGCAVETEARVDFPSQNTQGGRLDFDYRKLEISNEPEVQVDEEIIFESVISEEFIAWEWEFGDGNESSDKDPIHIFEKPGTFEVSLTAYDIYGCSSVEKNTVTVNNPMDLVVIPNAFTPNGDGLNDAFFPKIRAVSSFSMDIFNTWGERIYAVSNAESKGWDGTYRGQALPAGNYLYKITYSSRDGQVFDRNGGITLIR
ncbi:MAG: gliding motility-associated C-terminal domain-containing protein [Algoriphagus sp.]|nr:gliding motility-associated C-terminal domain-containing protein [Algoriphagus sp.]